MELMVITVLAVIREVVALDIHADCLKIVIRKNGFDINKMLNTFLEELSWKIGIRIYMEVVEETENFVELLFTMNMRKGGINYNELSEKNRL